jgi:hypothetical protein
MLAKVVHETAIDGVFHLVEDRENNDKGSAR